MRPREVFVSHATADRAIAQRIIRALGTRRIRTWYAPYRLIGSQKWHDQIGAALARCDWFAVLLSGASVRSRWVKNELLFVLNEPRLDDRIVPILVEDCAWRRLSWTLGAIQRVDFRNDFEAGMASLLRVWDVQA